MPKGAPSRSGIALRLCYMPYWRLKLKLVKATRLPAPAMPLLTRHDEYSLAHLIER
jgi:hypothetical protein